MEETTQFAWPTCPACGKRRTTQCPVCHNAGNQFPAADFDMSALLGLEPAAGAQTPCCGPSGCGNATCGEPETPTTEMSLSPMLLCPTCDEPFVPEYLRTCEWCGHEFPDGREAPAVEEPDEINSRVLVATLGTVLALLAVAAYLAFLFR